MKIILKILGFVVCLILFFVLLLTGNIFFNLTGGVIISLLAFVFIIIVIVYSIQSLVYQRKKRSTNILAIVFAVAAIPVLFVPLILNILIQTQFSLVTGSALTPSYKVAILSYNAIGQAIAFEEKYEMLEIEGIKVHYPSHEKEHQKLIETTMDAIHDNETMFNDYFGKQSNDGLNVKISGLLVEETHFESGYYRSEEKQIYLPIPLKQSGWQSLYETMVHEYAHYRFHMAVLEKGGDPKYFPSWFKEGISTHLQFIDEDLNIEEMKEKELLPFDEIAFDIHWDEKRLDERYHPYFQSKKLVDKLVDQEGLEVIMEIVDKTIEYHSFEQAFLIVVGETTEDFGNEVIRDIEQRINGK
ncbi:hypothetical protein ACFOZY_08630 [Chungangia koreensis]|uniref:Peptidase MA superfamily protein n=1 Tax=Chungangia koreensis TaxID=752657 RepID=A0ABV8X522_9LACT